MVSDGLCGSKCVSGKKSGWSGNFRWMQLFLAAERVAYSAGLAESTLTYGVSVWKRATAVEQESQLRHSVVHVRFPPCTSS
jgi:hypothetical protein